MTNLTSSRFVPAALIAVSAGLATLSLGGCRPGDAPARVDPTPTASADSKVVGELLNMPKGGLVDAKGFLMSQIDSHGTPTFSLSSAPDGSAFNIPVVLVSDRAGTAAENLTPLVGELVVMSGELRINPAGERSFVFSAGGIVTRLDWSFCGTE